MNADVKVFPIADGGEGMVAALVLALNGEIAEAAGITLISDKEKNPLKTAYGIDEMINDAIHKGCRKFIIGLGGSSANNSGFGMLSALGFKFLDVKGNEIPLEGKGLEQINSSLLDAVMCLPLKKVLMKNVWRIWIAGFQIMRILSNNIFRVFRCAVLWKKQWEMRKKI